MTPSENVEDRAAKNFRSVIREKIEKSEQRHSSRFVYAASTFLVLVVLVIGVTMVNNYDKMQLVQDSLDTISESVSDTGKEVRETSGTVVKAEDADRQEQGDEQKATDKKQKEDVYVVEKGDTLATISRKAYGDLSHIEAICKMNGLEDGNLIFIGQKLLLP